MAERRASLTEPRLENLLERENSKFTLVTLAVAPRPGDQRLLQPPRRRARQDRPAPGHVGVAQAPVHRPRGDRGRQDRQGRAPRGGRGRRDQRRGRRGAARVPDARRARRARRLIRVRRGDVVRPPGRARGLGRDRGLQGDRALPPPGGRGCARRPGPDRGRHPLRRRPDVLRPGIGARPCRALRRDERPDPAHPDRPVRRPRPRRAGHGPPDRQVRGGHLRRPAERHAARDPGTGRARTGDAHRDVGARRGAGEPRHPPPARRARGRARVGPARRRRRGGGPVGRPRADPGGGGRRRRTPR